MARRFLLFLSVLILIACAFIVTINFNSTLTILSLMVAVALSFIIMFLTFGFHTGYLSELNGDLPNAIESIVNLFMSASESIRILSGQLSPEIFSNPEVVKELNEARKRGVKIEIVLGEPDAQIMNGEEVKKLANYIGRAKKRVCSHFIVIDGEHVRIEDKHPKRTDFAQPQHRKARIRFFASSLAQYFSKQFELIKANSTPLVGAHYGK